MGPEGRAPSGPGTPPGRSATTGPAQPAGAPARPASPRRSAWAMRGSGPSTVDGGGHGLAASHRRQRPGVGVLGQQERQRRRPGAGQAQPDQRRLDRLVVDLGVAAVPVLDLEALGQVLADQLGQHHLADLVECRLRVGAGRAARAPPGTSSPKSSSPVWARAAAFRSAGLCMHSPWIESSVEVDRSIRRGRRRPHQSFMRRPTTLARLRSEHWVGTERAGETFSWRQTPMSARGRCR